MPLYLQQSTRGPTEPRQMAKIPCVRENLPAGSVFLKTTERSASARSARLRGLVSRLHVGSLRAASWRPSLWSIFPTAIPRDWYNPRDTHTNNTRKLCGSGEHDVMHLHRAYGTAAVEEISSAKEHYMYPSPAAKGTSLGARAMACPCTCQPPPRLLWLSRGLLLERREHVVDHLPGAGGGR